MRYGWIITKDHLDQEHSPQGGASWSDAGTVGPRNVPTDIERRLKGGAGLHFQMFDADDELYYSGRYIGGPEGDEETSQTLSQMAFGPLDDFGEPNAGCTRIAYWDHETEQWRTL